MKNISNLQQQRRGLIEHYAYSSQLQLQTADHQPKQLSANHRSKTMMNLMKVNSSKPKKTILVKVNSNEALNSNKSEMATR